jgi:hypothetical protein
MALGLQPGDYEKALEELASPDNYDLKLFAETKLRYDSLLQNDSIVADDLSARDSDLSLPNILDQHSTSESSMSKNMRAKQADHHYVLFA